MRYEIIGEATTATVDTHGAELVSLVDILGQEHLWCGDPSYWGRTAPVLFPVIGCLKDGKTRIGEKEYRIPKHGFARDEEFEVLYQKDNAICLSLKYNDRLLQMYPYRFELQVSYTVGANSVETKFTVLNLDDKDIFFTVGGHPAFRCPVSGEEPFESYAVTFEEEEDLFSPQLDENGIIQTGKTVKILDKSRSFGVKYALFENDALIFDHPRSKKVTLFSKLSGQGVELSFEGFSTLGIWTPAGKQAPFLCLEPWIGMADRDDETGAFEEKKDAVRLPVGKSFSCAYRMEII
ncbi:aldose 1-epimerase family protein [Zongyangia hominis]|uniref:Aldose 1-epimerase family protein n=1 Tax=Zongyangia hominis TaxID=2763677 RepID=A0A926I615_9FIRM|nr:aldose 1-epimerase family protein [Zongyangia hominis]MBC8569519.1 aldose 1-epimerase family protein [Zongyangia hominis]